MVATAAFREQTLPLRDSIRFAMRLATVLTVYSLGLFTAAIIVATVKRDPGRIREILSWMPLIAGGYYAGALFGGSAFWALRPARRSVIGWVLTGIAVAGCVYGSVTLVGILAYVFADINILDLRSPEAAWTYLLPITGLGAIGAGIPTGLWFWWKDRRGA